MRSHESRTPNHDPAPTRATILKRRQLDQPKVEVTVNPIYFFSSLLAPAFFLTSLCFITFPLRDSQYFCLCDVWILLNKRGPALAYVICSSHQFLMVECLHVLYRRPSTLMISVTGSESYIQHNAYEVHY